MTVASMYQDGNSTCSRRILAPICCRPRERALTYCNGPHAAGAGLDPSAVCGLHASCPPSSCGSGWTSCSRFPRPEGACLSHCFPPSPFSASLLLSVLLCTLPLGLTAMPNGVDAVRQGRHTYVPSWSSAFSPQRLACHGMPAVD